MEINEANFKILAQYLQQTLSPDPNVRRPAEKFLEEEISQNYAILLLNLVGKEDLNHTIRVAGAIAFKNFVKRNWNAHVDSDGPNRIHESDRVAIKQFIVTLMLKSSWQIQKQLSAAVSIIGKYDFPEKWPQLIDEMVEKFASGDFHLINGVLQTAHSIFKRYRYEFKSQKLWEEIKLVLDKFAKPLTELLVTTMQLTKTHENNEKALLVLYSSLNLVAKVFYSLNAQDLPEFFEDNMETWMNVYHELLVTDVPCLHTKDEEEDPGILDELHSQICNNLGLYAQKYDEEFKTYMERFVTDIWGLLVKTGIETKYDTLVANALQFLSTVADRNHYRQLFEDPNVLASICEKVIIPNMDFRTSDEELFEDNAEEYIRRDIEGSDIETRRRAACDLVKTLSQNFEAKIFEIFSKYLEVLLNKYAENPATNWRAKDTAIFLVTSLASRGQTQKHGVTQASQLVPLPQFCEQQIIPELEQPNINELPVLKADALRFLMTFRTVLGAQKMIAYLPYLIRYLPAERTVVHSYAACTIEKILIMRGPDNSNIVTQAHLQPLSVELLTGLFAVLNNQQSCENEYVMKAIMRSFATLQEAALPFMSVAFPRLTEILDQVSKNPSRPHFNHYLFETLALAIKIVCQSQPDAVNSFEIALFPIFQNILQQDIAEFMPYVFQLLAVLMEVREGQNVVADPYWALFPCLLSPTLWDRTGNVTPLIRLISAFIRQGSAQIAAQDKLNAVLGVFQKMIASKSNDHEGFFLLQQLFLYYPWNELQQNIRQILNLLFQRLSLSKTTKYVRGIIVFLSFYAAKIDPSSLIEIIDNIQAQMFGMVLERVLIPDMAKVAAELDRKIVGIGITKLLCDCPAMLAQYRKFWTPLLQTLIGSFELPPETGHFEADLLADYDDSAAGYQAAYSQLIYAQTKTTDPFAEITDNRRFLAEKLAQLSQTRPGDIPTLISALHSDHKQALQKYCDQNGVRIV